jgi:hypothetical protein
MLNVWYCEQQTYALEIILIPSDVKGIKNILYIRAYIAIKNILVAETILFIQVLVVGTAIKQD